MQFFWYRTPQNWSINSEFFIHWHPGQNIILNSHIFTFNCFSANIATLIYGKIGLQLNTGIAHDVRSWICTNHHGFSFLDIKLKTANRTFCCSEIIYLVLEDTFQLYFILWILQILYCLNISFKHIFYILIHHFLLFETLNIYFLCGFFSFIFYFFLFLPIN